MMSEEETFWSIQIFNNKKNEYVDYIYSKPIKMLDGSLLINGKYFGSSSRLGKKGTIYCNNMFNLLKFRILNENKDIIKEYQLTIDDCKSMIETVYNTCSVENLQIFARELYRFPECPYEICGVAIKL